MSWILLILNILSESDYFRTYTAATIAGEPLSNIRTKCYNTATTLTSLLKSVGAPPSHQQVLQLFYAACYAKNEAHVKDAWDLLGEAIQISVDLGMHEEQVARKDLPEFELDMRRRTFWNLYIWDRQVYSIFIMSIVTNHFSMLLMQFLPIGSCPQSSTDGLEYWRSVALSLTP